MLAPPFLFDEQTASQWLIVGLGRLVVWIPGIPENESGIGILGARTPVRIPNHRAPNQQRRCGKVVSTVSIAMLAIRGRVRPIRMGGLGVGDETIWEFGL